MSVGAILPKTLYTSFRSLPYPTAKSGEIAKEVGFKLGATS